MSMKTSWGGSIRFCLTFSLAILFVLAPLTAWSQGFQGTIRGSVQDPTGAQIPGATVTATNVGTGETRTQITSDNGIFNFPNLLVGTYTVTVELQGFKKLTRENIQVSANSIADVVARLEVGSVSEEVSVTVGEQKVELSTAQLEGYTTRNIVDLPNPMLTGNPNNFAILAPGTTTMPGGVAGTGGSIGGNRPRNNNFVVDGMDNNDPSVTGPITSVIAEAVEEFTLLTNQFSAEYGHSTAGQFITTTKSGTNELRGRAWWYNQNRHLNSLDNLTRATTAPGSPKPRYDWNRFGAQAGGPILRDKWFYFSSYEYQNQSLAGTPSGQILVPTAAGLQTLQSLAGQAGTGVSPANVGILAAHVPTAAAQIRTTNVTNELTGAQVAIPVGQFSATTPQFDRTQLFLLNSDYQTSRHRFSGRYNYTRNPFISAGALPVAKFNSNQSRITHRIGFSEVFTVSPRIVNEFRAGYNRAASVSPVDLPAAPGATDIFGNYNVVDLSLNIGPSSNFPQSDTRQIYTFSNTTSFQFGSHTLKVGAELRNIIAIGGFLPRARGEFTWTNLDAFVRDTFPTTVSIRGVGTGTFSQNRTAYYGFAQDNWKFHPRFTLEYGLRYELTTPARDQALQDLNGIANIVSIRDEVHTAETVAINGLPTSMIGQNIFNNLPPVHQQLLLGTIGERLLFRRPEADINNFAPRIGLAWDIFGDGRTSLRAGAGISHDVIYGNLALLQLPPQLQAENRESNACILSPRPAWCSQVPAGTSPRNVTEIRHNNIGFIEGGGLLPALPPGTRINRYTARAATGNFVPDEKVPEAYTWSLSLQREVGNDWMVEGRYVGNHVINLPVQRWKSAGVPVSFRLPLFLSDSAALGTNFANAPTLAQFQSQQNLLLLPYGFGGVGTTFTPDGQSWYHGGSINLEKRMSRGLQFTTNYTWSKTLDTIENDLFTSLLNPRRPSNHLNLSENKGLSGLHREHKFVLSWIYDLPGYGGGGALSKLASGWQVNGMFIAESGQPITIISNRDVNGDLDTAGDRVFVNSNGQANVGSDVNVVCRNAVGIASISGTTAGCGGAANVVGYVAQNPNAQYIRGALGMATNSSRGNFIMPGINTWNLSFFKNTSIWEERELQFRVELWNAFNHPSYTLGTGSVIGKTSAATGNPGYVTPGSPQFLDKNILSGSLGNNPFQRIIQLGLRLNF